MAARAFPVLLATLSAAAPAAAHLGNLSYSEVVARGGEVDVKLRFAAHLIPGTGEAAAGKLTRRDVITREADVSEWLRGGLRIDMGGARCTGALVDSMGPDSNDDLTVVLHYVCPAASDALRVEMHAFDAMMPDYQNIASVRYAGGASAFVFTAASPVLALGGAAGTAGGDAPAAPGGVYGFFLLGVEHIATGYDHLLFLLALLIAGGSIGRLAGIVTAFTVAHSITLALAALDVVSLPVLPVEAAIAASVLLAAVVALRMLNEGRRDHRALLTFAFGLVHGFGFAGGLRSTGLPAESRALPLLAFNLGVEAGQLVLVIVAVPLINLLARSAAGRRVLVGVAWAIAAVATFLVAERLAALTYR